MENKKDELLEMEERFKKCINELNTSEEIKKCNNKLKTTEKELNNICNKHKSDCRNCPLVIIEGCKMSCIKGEILNKAVERCKDEMYEMLGFDTKKLNDNFKVDEE